MIPAESATTIVPADFDKDGFIDLAVPSRDAGRATSTSTTARPGSPNGAVRSGGRRGARRRGRGFQQRRLVDLVVGDEAAATHVVYLNDGKGELAPGFRVADKAKTPYAIAAGDLERRSPPTRPSATPRAGTPFLQRRHWTYISVRSRSAKQGSAYGFALGDINSDGFPDIALARSGRPERAVSERQVGRPGRHVAVGSSPGAIDGRPTRAFDALHP